MRDYTKIAAWKLADDLTVAIYERTRSFPRDEIYGLTSQLRRASYSVPANIAEGSSRESQKDYLHFLYISRGSLAETQYFIHLAHRLHYLNDEEALNLIGQTKQAFACLHGLIHAVEKEAGKSRRPVVLSSRSLSLPVRILILNQFYLPDMAPTGQHAHDLARVLVQRGHQVKVICSCRSYDGASSYLRHEIMDGVEIARLPATGFGRRGFLGKIADYASFYVSLLVALLAQKNHPDLIVSLTTPPYIGLLAKLAAKRYGCRHAHWIMDLYPDVMVAHGMARSPVLTGFLRKLTQFQFKGACQVMTLGPNMAECVSRYVPGHTPGSTPAGNGQCQVSWFPLWSKPELAPWPEGELNPLRAERKWTADQAVFLYSGNMGLGHRFREFLEAARRLGSAGPRWVFAGGGKRKAEVVNAAKSIPDARIDFLGYVPHTDLRAHLCAAEVHLVSLDSAWQGFMVPSKLQGSFAVGRSVIYVGGRNCETAAWIQESGGGWVVDEDDVEGLLKAVQQALDPVERRKRGQAALKFAQQHFQTHANCTRMAQVLESSGSLQDH